MVILLKLFFFKWSRKNTYSQIHTDILFQNAKLKSNIFFKIDIQLREFLLKTLSLRKKTVFDKSPHPWELIPIQECWKNSDPGIQKFVHTILNNNLYFSKAVWPKMSNPCNSNINEAKQMPNKFKYERIHVLPNYSSLFPFYAIQIINSAQFFNKKLNLNFPFLNFKKPN